MSCKDSYSQQAKSLALLSCISLINTVLCDTLQSPVFLHWLFRELCKPPMQVCNLAFVPGPGAPVPKVTLRNDIIAVNPKCKTEPLMI